MSVEKRNRKFDLDKLIEDTFKEIEAISSSDKSVGLKTQSFKRLATKVVNRLFGERSRKNPHTALSLKTASKYLSRLRNQISERGWKHHSFDQSASRIVNLYPFSAYMIDDLCELDLERTRVKVKSVRDKLAQSDRLIKRLSALDTNLSTYASAVNAISKDFPAWAQEIDGLKTLKATDRAAALEKLMRVLGEAQPLYNDLTSLKIDHEIMRHLTKDQFTRKAGIDADAEVLNVKKTNTISIDYPTLMARVEFLLNPVHPGLWSYEALATGVGFATGRRDIEVLIQGRFEKTGKNTFRFSGQAKERGGVDYENQYDIYSLVDTDVVLRALELLRSKPNVAGMIKELEGYQDMRYYQFNELVHNRTAAPLNKFMREFMDGAGFVISGLERNWTSKDTRAIYAAICFKLFFETDPRWAKKDQDIFFQELLGHSDARAQAHYKAFKIMNAGQKWEPIKTANKDRLAELKKLDSDERIQKSEPYSRIHETVKRIIAQDPGIKSISQRMIKNECGGNFQTIKFYLDEIAKEALSLETSLESILKQEVAVSEVKNKVETNTIDSQADEVVKNEPLADEKPKLITKKLDNGQWEVTITYQNNTHVELVADAANMMVAGGVALKQWDAKRKLPELAPDPIVSKDGKMWYSRIVIHGQVLCEAWNPNKTFAKQASIAMYKSMRG
ncbi:protelomerase family protein [Oceanimonas smirnovii]|uniref:protelomerase family protein n=1 Tax=Oceanimonas smirnovii TaxID=264574 RepID=UPI003FD646C2